MDITLALTQNKLKTNWVICFYCVLLWLTNWNQSYAYDNKSTSVSLMGSGAIVSCIILIVLLVKTWKLIRLLLDKGIKIPRKIPLWGYKIYLILLIPLMLRSATTSSHTSHDGSAYIHTFQYGGNLSSYTILYAAIAIMLYQLHANLKTIIKEQEYQESPIDLLNNEQ